MLVSNIQFSYLKGGAWNAFSGTSETTMDGIKIQTPANNDYYLKYRTWNEGKTDWYSRVDSNVDDYAGAPNRPIQRLQIQVYQNDGTKLTEKIVVMYRARIAGRWLPWVSNAEPEWMQSVHTKYNLGGTIDTDSYYAGNAGENMDGLEIRVYEEGLLGDFTGGEVGAASLQYMVGSLDNWQSFDNGVYAEQIDGIKIQTSTAKGYYLQYRTWNEGKTNWYSFVKSTGTAYNDYAGLPGKPIQLLEIQAYKNDGTKLRSGVIVMYRVSVAGRWLPWVSNADPEWMRDMQNKHSLGGTLSVSSTYAGNAGQNIDGVEIRIFEDDSENAGSGSFTGFEEIVSASYMNDSLSNWTPFEKIATAAKIDGISLGTDADEPYYFMYKSWNEGNDYFYPEVNSLYNGGNHYAGYPGKPMQLLSISVYSQDGTKLRSGVVVMYRVRVAGRWLPWVSNADPEWMQSVQKQYGLDGTLDTKSTYAGNKGQNIDGVEIRVFQGETDYQPVGPLPGTESSAALSYMTDSLSNWTAFTGTALNDHIDGIKIQTDTSKPYYLSYRSWNAGKGQYYPYVDSRGTAYNDYAGYPGKPIQLLNIYVYAKDGTKLKSGVVVMYRVRIAGRWLPWVSNADPEWMVSVQEKYDLGGTLDTKSTYAGNKGQNIDGVEIHIFEENNTNGGTITPVGNYKIIPNVPFISQIPKYPTGCESVSTVMALQYAGVSMTVENFIDNYLDKGNRKSFDPDICFGGDPYATSGYGCYSPVIKKALDRILKDSLLYAKEEHRKTIDYLCSEYIDRDIPVIFWATQNMAAPRNGTLIRYEDRDIQWISPMHCLLLVGYDDTHYIFNDPQKHALTYYSKESVKRAYDGLFQQAVVILNKTETLDRLDRRVLMNTYYFSGTFNPEGAENLHSSEFNDYNALACLQLLYVYYYDQQDFEKTDFLYDEMLNLRKLNPSYRIIYVDFLDRNGEFDLGYQYYAKGRKTAKIFYPRTVYFTKETIQDMHRADSWTEFMTSLIPTVGPGLSTLLAAANAAEQNQTVEIAKELISGGASIFLDYKVFPEIAKKLKISAKSLSALSTFIDFCYTAYDTAGENRETYVRDGVTLQDGDSYVEVRLEYDMGVEQHDFSFYFRNGYPYVTNLPQYIERWDLDSRGKGVAKNRAEAFAAEGYVPSEKHNPRGPYWPLES